MHKPRMLKLDADGILLDHRPVPSAQEDRRAMQRDGYREVLVRETVKPIWNQLVGQPLTIQGNAMEVTKAMADKAEADYEKRRNAALRSDLEERAAQADMAADWLESKGKSGEMQRKKSLSLLAQAEALEPKEEE